jgi:paraquat-inducible protein B
MSKQANKTLIGGFLVGAVALIAAGVLIFGSGRFMSEMRTVVMYFDGSVKGLDVGSPVVFRGVKIGSVTNIMIRANTDDLSVQIPVFIEVDPDRIEKVEQSGRFIPGDVKMLRGIGLRAQLQMKSMVTGQMMIELDFYPDKPAKLVGDGTVPEIPTIPSSIEELAKRIGKVPVEEIFKKLLTAVEGIEKVVNSPGMQKLPASLNLTLEDTRKLVRNIDQKVDSLGSSADETFKDYGKLARNVDGKVEPLATGIDEAMRDIRKMANNTDGRIEQLAASVEETAQEATETLAQAKETLSTVEEDSAVTYELTKMLKELASAAHSIRMLAEYFERHPDALLQGKGESGGK